MPVLSSCRRDNDGIVIDKATGAKRNNMKIRSKVLLVVLPLLIFPAFLIGYTGLISAKNGITKVTKEFLNKYLGAISTLWEEKDNKTSFTMNTVFFIGEKNELLIDSYLQKHKQLLDAMEKELFRFNHRQT